MPLATADAAPSPGPKVSQPQRWRTRQPAQHSDRWRCSCWRPYRYQLQDAAHGLGTRHAAVRTNPDIEQLEIGGGKAHADVGAANRGASSFSARRYCRHG